MSSLPIFDQENEEATGRTVQVLAFHPFYKTQILWGHNLLEAGGQIPPGCSGLKPAGWGNLGGGQEKNELNILRSIYPEHILFQRNDLSDAEKGIIACGIREFRWESGYTDFSPVIPNDDDFRLIQYRYLSGHEVVTMQARVNSFIREDIFESNEIDKAEWIDFTVPLSELFQDRLARPDRPYYSHVRRTVMSLEEMDRRALMRFGSDTALLSPLIHPSWRLSFALGFGDKRFPEVGYSIAYQDWYILFDDMVKNQMAMDKIDLDFIYHRFQDQIEFFKNRGGQGTLKAAYVRIANEPKSFSFIEKSASSKADQDDWSGQPLSNDIIAQEEAAYRALSLQAHDLEWQRFAESSK